MDQNVKVTIGIPIYNAEKHLYFAIKSVLDQSYKNFELILSDDGSTDYSLEIVRSFHDSRIIIISDGKNRGISYRLNQQISLAQGKYFVRMDADDMMFPTRIERELEYLETNTLIDVVGSYAITIDNSNKVIGMRKSSIPNSIIKCFKSVPFIHPTVMGKSHWFKKYKYIDDLTGVEDADLWIRSFNNSNFAIIKEPLLFYRDPLNLKLTTYKFRISQSYKLYKNNINLVDNSFLSLYKFRFYSFCKLIIYTFFCSIKLEYILVARRNIKLSNKENKAYEKIVKCVI